jgi:hypothetical protein
MLLFAICNLQFAIELRSNRKLQIANWQSPRRKVRGNGTINGAGRGTGGESPRVTRLDIDVSQPDRFEVHGRQ